ncbi:halocarboxylic acid dehydrogenase DehI family protein [Bacillus sp. SG-1]|uniref:halocarboxylic acid dehydrogenase DehI family protein n=1 Tax=Bacillus sp. SG-1 TaxID=161544 RepID=UPI00015434A0|nr:halocarboxylic acid dehydrogenase DehI family protein [Bacillus sp. SG-1]EDL66117.1 hypothetical protein BSG1_02155 [Bacillus sp. SG-1]
MRNKGGYGVPEIFENETYGNLELIYNDIKYVLKVPIVNFIFRTTAFYETFLTMAWHQVRPSMLTYKMEREAENLRNPTIEFEVPTFYLSNYYSIAEAKNLIKTIDIFNYVNPKLLLICSAWAESLAGRSISGGTSTVGAISPGVWPGLPEIEMVKIEETSYKNQQLLLDIAKTHQSYDAASDFRALAKYLEFLSEGWRCLKTYANTEEYTVTASRIKSQSIEMAHQMPYPVWINRDILSNYYSDRDIAGIMGVISMFQDLLPKLIIDGEFFRKMIKN